MARLCRTEKSARSTSAAPSSSASTSTIRKLLQMPGGENFFTNDVEDALYRPPAVETVAVVGAPDPKWGEVVVAAVALRLGHSVTEEELIAHCKDHLSPFKVPKRIDFRKRLPMSS